MMITFRFCNIRFCLCFGFFAVTAIILCIENGKHFLPVMLAYGIHEFGHIITAKLCGMEITEVRFGMLGIHMRGTGQSLSTLRRAAVSISGPLINFFTCMLLLSMGNAWYAPQLLLFAFHILPAMPLDGGTALYYTLCSFVNEQNAENLIAAVSVVLAFLLGILGFLVLLRSKGNFSLLFAASYIFIYVLTKQREV